MKTNRALWLWLGAAALTAACGNGLPPNQPVQRQLSLVAFDSCSSLEKYIQDTAVLDMRSTLEQAKQNAYQYPVMMTDGPAVAGASAGAGASGPSAYTTTNTQVAGVDEADFVKNDGTRIFVLSGQTLYLNQSWPAASLGTVSSLSIEGWPREMFLDENDHVVVFSDVYTPLQGSPGPGSSPGLMIPCTSSRLCGGSSATLKTTVVDVSDLAHPRILRELYQPGSYTNSRRVGSSVRVVTSDGFRWPDGVQWYPDYSPVLANRNWRDKAFDELMNRNEQLIRAQKLADWLPRSYYKASDGSLTEVGYSCSEFHRISAPSRLGFVSVTTLDLSPTALAVDGAPTLHRTSLVAEAGLVYSSPTALYVTSPHWWWWPEAGQQAYTYIHKFDLLDPSGATYVGSGGVEGYVLDSYSMDEKDGYLRVATTLEKRVVDLGSLWGRVQYSNRLTVLSTNGGALQVAGQSDEISPGEALYSSRFIGNKGFLVTFHQVDPLITFDLSDPAHPRQVGQLQVPGYSTYLHPIDDNHLLAIGEYVPENNTDWQARSVKLSLFDVTDLANPRQVATQLVGTYSSWSDAMWDHKAFNYFPERHLLAIPFADWHLTATSYWDGFASDLRVFTVDPVNGFTPMGALTMTDVYAQENDNGWAWYFTPYIRRSVMADNYVYAISDGGLRVADVGSLDSPIATVLFNPYKP